MYIELLSKPDNEIHYLSADDGTRLLALGPIASVNMFVGANNSGKSRLLRSLVRGTPHHAFKEVDSISSLSRIVTMCTALRDTLSGRAIQFHIQPSTSSEEPPEQFNLLGGARAGTVSLDSGTMDQLIKSVKEHATAPNQADHFQHLFSTSQHVRAIAYIASRGTVNPSGSTHGMFQVSQWSVTPAQVDLCKQIAKELGKDSTRFAKELLIPPKSIYIPLLRTAAPIDGGGGPINSDPLAQTASVHWDLKSGDKLQIFSGMSLHDSISKQRNGPRDTRDRFTVFEKFLSERFFEGQRIDVVARESRQHIAVTVGEVERSLQELGDGIGHLIMLTYPAFMAEPGAWLFIEEPEIALHPGLQRVFLETLLGHSALREKNLRVFFTTHSNHLLGIAQELPGADLSVFHFRPSRSKGQEAFHVRHIRCPDLEIIGSLGANNSSVFIANCAIWVEGTTDRTYVKAYLTAYMAHLTQQKTPTSLLEDIHYGFFEYAGSNIAHYVFDDDSRSDSAIRGRFISNRVFLIADRDRGKENLHERRRRWNGAHFEYFVTEGVEIENMLSAEHLQSLLPELFERASGGPYELSKERCVSESLGAYLKEVMGKSFPTGALAPSGTLDTRYKVKLAQLAAAGMTWELMSDEAKRLAVALVRFIQSHSR